MPVCLRAAVVMGGTQKCLAREDASVAWEWNESRCFLLCVRVRGPLGVTSVELLKSVILRLLSSPWAIHVSSDNLNHCYKYLVREDNVNDCQTTTGVLLKKKKSEPDILQYDETYCTTILPTRLGLIPQYYSYHSRWMWVCSNNEHLKHTVYQ